MDNEPSDTGPGPVVREGLLPKLSALEWLVFAILAAVIAAANIYTTLLIGWGDTGSIIAVLASVVMLGLVSKHRPSIRVLNLGQTMVSAGGSVGFAVASYAAVRIVDPTFDPPVYQLVVLFAAMGVLGAIVGSSVRKAMVGYFFPSGTACAVIQRSVTAELKPGEKSRPIFLLTLWGSIAALLSIPSKISLERDGAALWQNFQFKLGSGASEKTLGVGVDPLYFGIGVVVGPRVGIGMLIGALAVPYLIVDGLAGTEYAAATSDWVRWMAIAVLTLPTFAAIGFAYRYKTPAVVPPGFHPGHTEYVPPSRRTPTSIALGVLATIVIMLCAREVFALPWYATLLVITVAWPLCVVNGRVTGDTDINPVRLVAVVLLSGFFWLVAEGQAITMLGMAVVGGTLAAVAVDMMQDYRTGYLVDANPDHQTSVQFLGALVGALVAIPVLNVLLSETGGLGEGTPLKAPGAQVWAAMAQTIAGGFQMSTAMKDWVVGVSLAGCGYAFLTVWPVTARWMPSLFGIGIGMLVGFEASAAIFLGGMIKWLVSVAYTSGKTGAEREERAQDAGNDTMLAGSSAFAAGAVVSIALVLLVALLRKVGWEPFYLAS